MTAGSDDQTAERVLQLGALPLVTGSGLRDLDLAKCCRGSTRSLQHLPGKPLRPSWLLCEPLDSKASVRWRAKRTRAVYGLWGLVAQFRGGIYFPWREMSRISKFSGFSPVVIWQRARPRLPEIPSPSLRAGAAALDGGLEA